MVCDKSCDQEEKLIGNEKWSRNGAAKRKETSTTPTPFFIPNEFSSCVCIESVKELYQQCTKFLGFLECYVHRYIMSGDGCANRKQMALDIATQLPPLCQHLGPLEGHLGVLRTGGPLEPVAHITVRIHWMSLHVLHRMIPVLGIGRFLECAHTILVSCLHEAAVVFNRSGSGACSSSSFYACPCILDILLVIVHCLDSNSKSFWDFLFDNLLCLLNLPTQHSKASGHSLSPDPLPVTDHVLYAWWILSQLAPLSMYSDVGALNKLATPISNNWSFICDHLSTLTFDLSVSEVRVHQSLECAVELVKWWGPSCQLISKAWEFFHKYMNEPAAYSRKALGGLGYAPASRQSYIPRQLLEHAMSLCYHDNQDRAPPTDCSTYELFLCLLSCMLCCHGDIGGMWKQLRGRFYSKVHRQWMNELSVEGLGRMVTLFLVVTASSGADAQEVSNKMVTNLSYLSLSSPRDRLTPLMWGGLFALVLLHEQLNLSMTSLISKLLTPISDLIGQLGSADNQCAWDTVCVILDSCLEAIETPTGIALGACNLIGQHFSKLLGMLDGSKLSKVLHVVESLGTALSGHPSLTHSCCYGYLEHCIMPLPSQTLIPALTLHSTAASGTLLSLQWSDILGQTSHASQLLQEFGLRDSTHPFVASGYLCHVISSTVMCQQLLSTEHVQLAVLHTWLRCVLQSHTHPLTCDDHVIELTRQLYNMKLVSSLMEREARLWTEPMDFLRAFLSAARKDSIELESGSVWRERIERWFSDLVKIMEPILAGRGGVNAMRSCYCVASVVMCSCPELIYSRIDSRCLLPQLVDLLVLPIATRKIPSTHGQAICIKANLHHFIYGLLQLSPDKDDFIKRKLRQIFSQYFKSYCQPCLFSSPITANPFMLLLSPWFEEQPPIASEEQLMFIVRTITSQFLQLPQQPASLLPTLQFLREFVECLRYHQVSVCLSLLPSILLCLLACDVCQPHTEPTGIRTQAMVIARVLLGTKPSAPLQSLLTLVDTFISCNIGQPRGAAVFKTLIYLLTLHPPLVTPTLSLALRAVERGEDSALRDGYSSLQTAVSSLQTDQRTCAVTNSKYTTD